MNQVTETAVSLMNDVAVGVFGILLSASFGCVLRSRRNRIVLLLCIIPIMFSQLLASWAWGADMCTKLYPLIVHIPLVLMLFILTKKLLWSVISVLCAYLFCEIRRWFALLVVVIIHGGDYTQKITELIITVPLLLFLMRFASPAMQQIINYPTKTQCQFGFIPLIYYAFDYVTRIYTNLLSSDSAVVLEFMPFVCCVAYLMFVLHNFAEERNRQCLNQIQNNLDIQLTQAVREITRLRESQAQTARYRHDLRHHLQYLSACLENGQEERAKSYISDICEEIEAQKVLSYCENEAANLILSAFAGRAKKSGIDIEVRGAVTNDITVSDNDLCVLLSNSLENALNSCLPIARDGEKCVISVQFRFVNSGGKLFIQITNPYRGDIKFENGIPISSQQNHGIGVQSICAIVERCGGCYSFSLEDGLFVLRLSL